MRLVRCYIGMGSNLENPLRQLKTAEKAFQVDSHFKVVAVSPCYRSRALGPSEQPDYCNAVVALKTDYSPAELLGALQQIEKSQGRKRENIPRWSARTLDLDILLYGEEIINEPDLTVPHPEMKNRNFVIAPLADISPDLEIPGTGKVSDLLAKLGFEGLEPWAKEEQ